MFGFCKPDFFLFRCYVFGFVDAVLVFPRIVPTKSETPTPQGQFLGVRKSIVNDIKRHACHGKSGGALDSQVSQPSALSP